MKKIKLILLGLLLMTVTQFQAQVSINVQFGTPPVWAPVDRVETQYYYLPDIDAYYDVPTANFIYIKNGRWFRSTSLPYRYRNYNLRGGNVVYLTDYRGNSPYMYHKNHKEKYRGNRVERPREEEHHDDGNQHREEHHDNDGNHGHGGKHRG
jgi:hypothetical protein